MRYQSNSRTRSDTGDDGVFWTKGSLGTRCSVIAGYRPPTKPVPARNETLRAFAKKAGYKFVGFWEEVASGARLDRIKRKKVLHSMRAHVATPIPEPGRSLMGLR